VTKKITALLLMAITAIFFLSGQAVASNRFNGLETFATDDGHRLVFSFEESSKIKMRFLERAIDIDVSDAYISPSKLEFNLPGTGLRKVQVYQFSKNMLRLRVLTKRPIADYKGRILLSSDGAKVIITLPTLAKTIATHNTEKPAEISATAKDTPKIDEPEKASKIPTEIEPQTDVTKDSEQKNLTDEIKIDETADRESPLAGIEGLKGSLKTSNGDSAFLDYEEPSVPAMPSMGASLVKVVSGLLIVLSLVLLVGYIAKKYLNGNEGRFGNNKEVSILSNHFIGVKKNVTIIEVAGEILVLGVTNENINLLAKYDEPEKIEKIKLNNRLPKDPIGIVKKIPGVNWGVSAKNAVSKKFSRQVSGYAKEQANTNAKPVKEEKVMTRDELSKRLADGLAKQLKGTGTHQETATA